MSAIHPLTMPKWGLTMKEGKVVSWLVDEGDDITSGDEFAEVETDKTLGGAEAHKEGTLRRRVAEEGQTLPVGALLAVVADEETSDADIDAFIADFQAKFVPPKDDEETDPSTGSGQVPKTVQVDGRSIRYLKMGDDAATVLLIHGFGGDLNNWLFNHESLATKATVYALDLPGHGESTKDVGDATIDWFANQVEQFMQQVGIEKAHIAGHSMGGAITLALATIHPDRVASVTVLGSAGLGEDINNEYIEGFIAAEKRKDMKPQLQKLFSDPTMVNRDLVEDVLKFKRLDGVNDCLKAVAAGFCPDGKQVAVLRDKLGDLSIPVQTIWGAKDQIIPASHAEGLPPNVKTHVFDEASHMVQMEVAQKVNDLIAAQIG